MHTHIDTDIKFDESTEINKETKKELLEELNAGKIDKALLHDLRKSISVKPAHLAEENSESESSEEDLTADSPIGDVEHFSHRSDTAFDALFKPLSEDHTIHLRNVVVPKLNTTTQVVSFTHAQRPNTPAENIEITKTEIKTTEITTTEITTMFSNIDAFCDNIIGCDSPNTHDPHKTIVENEPVCDIIPDNQIIVDEAPAVEAPAVEPPIVDPPSIEPPQVESLIVEPPIVEALICDEVVAPPELEEEERSLPEEEEKSLPEEEAPREDDSKSKKKKPRKKKA
jgi:hypothetical protein